MTLVVTHSTVTGAAADADALVDGVAWDANHTLTGTISASQGGTGVANNDSSTLTISGSYGTTFTVTATTSLTLPTTGTLATLAGTEELDNKTLDSSVAKGTWTASGTWTLPALTLGGTVSGGAQTVNNLGATTAASFIPSGSSVPTNGVYLPGSNTLGLSTNSTLRGVLNSSGVLSVGHSASITQAFSVTPLIQSHATSANAGFSATRYDGSVATRAPLFIFGRSRGATVGSHSIVSAGDSLGNIFFEGSNGNSFERAAEIRCEVNNTPGASADMPGRLLFLTSPDGSSTVAERLRINSSGISVTGDATITSSGSSALAVGLAGATNPALQVDASTASQAAGLKITGAATGGTVALAAIDSGSNANLTINAKGSGTIGIGSVSTGAVTITPALSMVGVPTVASATATPAGGSTSARLLLGTTAGFGIYYGSGAPSVSAAQGSIYIRSDGSSTSTRLYVNTDGSTTWTNFTSAT